MTNILFSFMTSVLLLFPFNCLEGVEVKKTSITGPKEQNNSITQFRRNIIDDYDLPF